jgi:hypothetical protein
MRRLGINRFTCLRLLFPGLFLFLSHLHLLLSSLLLLLLLLAVVGVVVVVVVVGVVVVRVNS